MPELPEVEHLRRTLLPQVIGRCVVDVRLARRDVVRDGRGRRRGRVVRRELLAGSRIAQVLRRGKQLALVADDGAALVVHLGMTGQLRVLPAGGRLADGRHVHCVWRLIEDGGAGAGGETGAGGGAGAGGRLTSRTRRSTSAFAPAGRESVAPDAAPPALRASKPGVAGPTLDEPRKADSLSGGAQRNTLVFRDPRRFGGIWVCPSAGALEERWSQLGPDALTVRVSELADPLARTQRPIKAVLLDQAIVAGIGNIYADEILHAARIHPGAPARSLSPAAIQRLVRATRRILQRAIDAGGSTFRDYVDANGANGAYVTRHRVYGRGGEPCLRCGRTLAQTVIGGRTTVGCAGCQR